jgi:hypothetical protein
MQLFLETERLLLRQFTLEDVDESMEILGEIKKIK